MRLRSQDQHFRIATVAPFMGAWIETREITSRSYGSGGRALHGRVDYAKKLNQIRY